MKKLLLYSLLCCLTSQLVAKPAPSTVIIPRSQGRDKTRQLVGVTDFTHLFDMDCFWGMGSMMVEYTQSFDSHQLAKNLFGLDFKSDPCGSSSILIQGSQVANRNANAWLADYFYLPIDYQSRIRFKPQIQNVIIDLDLYVGLDAWWPGIYARAYGPIVHSIWNLNFSETIIDAGSAGYPIGYFASVAVPRSQLLGSFRDYAGGNTIESIDNITFNPLRFARLATTRKRKTGFADLRAEFGWDFLSSPCYHVGINIQAAMPTGNRPHARFTFSPIIGNGGHWELGGGITAHYLFWQSADELCHSGIYFDANLTHVFGRRQQRTFDLCGKANSRYMLAEFLDRPIENNLSASTNSNLINTDDPIVNPSAQFMRQYSPIANLSTDFVKVSAGVQADIVALLNFTYHCWQFDIGYNFWVQSCERIECPEQSGNPCGRNSLCNAAQVDKWALKGDARVFGFMIDNGTNLPTGTPVALSATESLATIHQGTNALVSDATAIAADPQFKKNFGVDSARFAYGDSSNNALVFSPTTLALADQIKTTLIPQFVSCSMLNFQRLRGLSHKIFGHLNYIFPEWCMTTPFLGIGGFAEFGSSSKKMQNCCNTVLPTFNTKCSSCLTASVSQWGLWLKGGVAF